LGSLRVALTIVDDGFFQQPPTTADPQSLATSPTDEEPSTKNQAQRTKHEEPSTKNHKQSSTPAQQA
jgi:hypothetical protein